MSRDQGLSPPCLATIFDSQLHSPKLSLKMPSKCLWPRREGFNASFKISPAVRVIARPWRDNISLATTSDSRHLDISSAPLGLDSRCVFTRNSCLACGGLGFLAYLYIFQDKRSLGVKGPSVLRAFSFGILHGSQ